MSPLIILVDCNTTVLIWCVYQYVNVFMPACVSACIEIHVCIQVSGCIDMGEHHISNCIVITVLPNDFTYSSLLLALSCFNHCPNSIMISKLFTKTLNLHLHLHLDLFLLAFNSSSFSPLSDTLVLQLHLYCFDHFHQNKYCSCWALSVSCLSWQLICVYSLQW